MEDLGSMATLVHFFLQIVSKKAVNFISVSSSLFVSYYFLLKIFEKKRQHGPITNSFQNESDGALCYFFKFLFCFGWG